MRITDVTDVTRHAQDPIYMQDLGKIKTLLEEGVLTEVEFNTKRAKLIEQRKERKAAAKAVCCATRTRMPDWAVSRAAP